MNTNVLFTLFMTVVQIYVLFRSGKLLKNTSHFLSVVFFIFAIACSLLSSLYWIAYDLLRPDTRMPFAANEIGEWAMFLLLAASLQRIRPENTGFGVEMALSGLFMLTNTVLWIVWFGEWIQDILTGLSLGWLICVCSCSMRYYGSVSVTEWLGIGIASLLTVSIQFLILFLPETMKTPLELFTYALLFLGNVYFILRTFLSLRSSKSAEQGISFAFSAFSWSAITLYMSSDIYYSIAMVLITFGFLFMLLSLRREAKQT